MAALVSIIIVNYRTYTELGACLQSIERFSIADLEILVVDQAADAAALAGVTRRFGWMHAIPLAENRGFASGLNHGARMTTGRYILALNPDCLVDTDVAHILAAWMDRNPTVGAAGPIVRESSGAVQDSARYFPNFTTGIAGRTSLLTRMLPGNRWTRRNLVRPADDRPVIVDWVSGACMFIRREAFERVGGMDARFFLYWEDADLCARLKHAGYSTAYVPAASVTHQTGRSSASAPIRSLMAFHASAFRYYLKHGSLAARIAAPAVLMGLLARLGFKLAIRLLTP